MPHGLISRKYPTLVLLAAAGLLSACSDNAVAPANTVAPFRAPANFSRSVDVVVFSVGPRGAIQSIGNNTIVIPARAICDPLTSSYGIGEWDNSCDVLNRPITITATLLEDSQGNPYVDFQPALRFVPSTEVDLYLRSPKNADAPVQNIQYCNNLGICVDESVSDSSLVTRRVGNTSLLMRRIKHFSGYMISSGLSSPSVDQALLALRSGYMVASGLRAKRKGMSR